MSNGLDLAKYKAKAKLANRYEKQLERLKGEDIATASIEAAVDGAIQNLTTAANGALVIYGEPQSGKTEMMICLTAKLLDAGHKIVVHLMNAASTCSRKILGVSRRPHWHRRRRTFRNSCKSPLPKIRLSWSCSARRMRATSKN